MRKEIAAIIKVRGVLRPRRHWFTPDSPMLKAEHIATITDGPLWIIKAIISGMSYSPTLSVSSVLLRLCYEAFIPPVLLSFPQRT